jgi:hypothetical protein
MISRLVRVFSRFTLIGVLLVAFAQAGAAQAVPQASIDKLVSMLKANNYPYVTTSSPSVFVIHFTGNHMKDIKVVLALGGDEDSDMVIFVTVVEKRRMPVTAEFRGHLLEQNHALNQVKIGFDADGDLSVRTDSSLRLCDARGLYNIVNQVKNASDEIYGQVESQLLPETKLQSEPF